MGATSDNAVLGSAQVLQKVLLGVGAAAIVTVGAWTADTLRDLTSEVTQLRLSMTILATKVESLPPKEMLLRLDMLEERQSKTEERIRVIGDRVHKRLGIDTVVE